MPWLQINITSDGGQAAAIDTLLLELGALSVTVIDAADQPLLEPGPDAHPMWDKVITTGLFTADIEPELIVLQLTANGISPGSISHESLADQQWETVWMDQYQPMQFGNQLWIYPTHIEPLEAQTKQTIIRLDPGLAFGSGTHPTTRLCLEWIDQVDLTGKTVIDYGCGSGILAIACALKGAAKVFAIDHDEQALQSTLANALLNNVVDKIVIGAADFDDYQMADILLANILAGPLTQLGPKFSQLTKLSGDIVLSGILDTQLGDLQVAYQKIAKVVGHAKQEEWIRIDIINEH